MEKINVPEKLKKIEGELQLNLHLKKNEILLQSEDILAYFLNKSTHINNLFADNKKTLVTTDFSLYEAINSMRGNIELPFESLKEFLFRVIIIPQNKILIGRDRINEIRSIAFSGGSLRPVIEDKPKPVVVVSEKQTEEEAPEKKGKSIIRRLAEEEIEVE